jgi:uncharacterized membrane protein YcaP (DUF421 family)
MWHSMFDLNPSILEKIIRPLVVYLFLVVAIRIGGQREIGQNNALQLVLLLSVANAVQNGIIGIDDSLTGAVIGAVTLFLANGVIEVLASRSHRFHNLVIGHPVELVSLGIVKTRTLRRQRMSINDVLQASVAAGASGVEDVQRAVLNANGEIVVTLKSSQSIPDQIKELSLKIDKLLLQKDQ